MNSDRKFSVYLNRGEGEQIQLSSDDCFALARAMKEGRLPEGRVNLDISIGGSDPAEEEARATLRRLFYEDPGDYEAVRRYIDELYAEKPEFDPQGLAEDVAEELEIRDFDY